MPETRRYSIIDPPQDCADHKLREWYGVNDEERGGIIAFFGREVDAINYITWRSDWDKKMAEGDKNGY